MALGLVLVLVLGVAVVLGLVAVVVLFVGRLGGSGAARARTDNQLVPGQDGVAPASWAGSHDREAVLHRRLVKALASVRASETAGGLAVTDLRIQLELHAEQLDRRLVACAVAVGPPREKALTGLTHAVDELESVAGQTVVVASGAEPDPASLEALSGRLRELGPGSA